MLESSKGMYKFHFFFWWLSKCKISSALKFLTVSQFILYLSSYFCFNSSMPESFGGSWVVVCWHLNLILLACNLTFFWKKWIRSIPHIWSQIPLFRVTLTYVNYLSFFDFFHLLLRLNAKHLDDSYCIKMSYKLNFWLLEVLFYLR